MFKSHCNLKKQFMKMFFIRFVILMASTRFPLLNPTLNCLLRFRDCNEKEQWELPRQSHEVVRFCCTARGWVILLLERSKIEKSATVFVFGTFSNSLAWFLPQFSGSIVCTWLVWLDGSFREIVFRKPEKERPYNNRLGKRWNCRD